VHGTQDLHRYTVLDPKDWFDARLQRISSRFSAGDAAEAVMEESSPPCCCTGWLGCLHLSHRAATNQPLICVLLCFLRQLFGAAKHSSTNCIVGSDGSRHLDDSHCLRNIQVPLGSGYQPCCYLFLSWIPYNTSWFGHDGAMAWVLRKLFLESTPSNSVRTYDVVVGKKLPRWVTQ
jgi:hypothetical protein